MLLKDEYYNLLNKIAKISKMDCWFHIVTIDDNDVVYDIENNIHLSLRQGVHELIDGLIEETYFELTNQEVFALIKLLGDLVNDEIK